MRNRRFVTPAILLLLVTATTATGWPGLDRRETPAFAAPGHAPLCPGHPGADSSAIGGSFRFPKGRHQQGRLQYVRGVPFVTRDLSPGRADKSAATSVPVLYVEGTPEQIGEQTAALLGESVRPLMDYPKKMMARYGREKYWPLVVATGRLLLRNVPERHRSELEAAIRASGLDPNAMIVGNTMLELRRMGGCSTLIVGAKRSKTGGVLFGRNFDFPPMGILNRYSLVTICRPKGRRAFVSVGFPGLTGVVSGMNDAGLSLATLDVYRSQDGSPMFDPGGVPMAFTFRRILEECETVAEAEKVLRSVKHTTWMNLAVADKNGGVVFELTPRSVVVRRPVDAVLPCTNHFRSEELAPPRSTSCNRYDALCRCRTQQEIGVEDLLRHLHAANQGEATIQTMIFEPAAKKLHVSLGDGPTSAGPLVALDLATLLAAGGSTKNRRPPPVLDVWPERPPGVKEKAGPETTQPPRDEKRPVTRITNVTRPTVTVYLPPKEKANGSAVLICPGGGYNILAWDLEGTEVARWLNSIGVAGIVLKYRVPRPPGRPRDEPPIGPLQDAQRAMSLVRSKSERWGIDPRRIGILGFSAGGHLAARTATGFAERSYQPIDETDNASCRPDFAVLVYPAYLIERGTERLSKEIRVTKQTPPVFFAHAGDDRISAENSVRMYLALKEAGVPAELHVYASGGHGFGLRPSRNPCSEWPAQCAAWLRSRGLLKPGDR